MNGAVSFPANKFPNTFRNLIVVYFRQSKFNHKETVFNLYLGFANLLVLSQKNITFIWVKN